MKASLAREGLLQPIRIREAPAAWGLPVGHRQIVFGERRFRAALALGWETIAAVDCGPLDDRSALELMATENGQRVDLDPVSRAEHLRDLTTPQADGSPAMTQAEAGELYGFSQPEVAQSLKMLRLPAAVLDLVRAGKLAATKARELVALEAAPRCLDLVAADVVKNADEWNDTRRANVLWKAEGIIRLHTRPMSRGDRWQYRPEGGRLFTPPRGAELEQLAVEDVPKVGKVATNVALWDKLQAPAWKARKAADDARGGRAAADDPQAAARRQVALDKQRRDKVRAAIGELRLRLLRCQVARNLPAEHWITAAVVPYVVATVSTTYRRELSSWVALVVGGVKLDDPPSRAALWQLWGGELLDLTSDADPATAQAALARLLFWPVVAQSQGAPLVYDRDNLPGVFDDVPDLLPDVVVDVAAALTTHAERECTVAAGWRNAAKYDSHERRLVESLLRYLRKAELAKLCGDLSTAGRRIEPGRNNDATVAEILDAHSAEPLAWPAMFGPTTANVRKRKGGA